MADPQQTGNTTDSQVYKDQMFKVIADLFEKVGAQDTAYSDLQKVTDILEVLATLTAFTIYNACPTSEAIRDAAEASYFQIKQMALAYYYQQKQEKDPNPVSVPRAQTRRA